MDSNLAHGSLSSINGRKRKASADEPQDASPPDSSDPMLVEPVATPNSFSNAPRQPPPSAPWLSPPSANTVQWPTNPPPVSPLTEIPDEESPCQKRPRIEREQSSLRPIKRLPRRQRSSGGTQLRSPPSCPPSRFWRRSDIRDMGIVPTEDSRRISDSLYHVKGGDPCASECGHHLLPSPLPPINLNSPHIPVLQPIINRRTLQELDLNAILRNPQLRHDLLFDSGLQFRPTSGRRKRELSDKYWDAVARELESGCTCVSFDLQGKPNVCVCVCRRVSPPPVNPVLAFSTFRRVLTLRMPSRIRPLLSEFLDLLLCVIQPLSGISGYVSPNTLQAQMQQHTTQAARLRSVFDPDLIEQEIRHGVFDPSGLFQTIGQVLKAHCAPMRDQAMEAMVEVARSCAPKGTGTKADAVRAVRMCLDILELMKLDIANHQLQTLRPFLIETSGQFELKAFRRRKGQGASVELTKKWLQTAHRHMLALETFSHPSCPSSSLSFRSLNRMLQAYLCVLKGFTDMIFDPPTPIQSSKLYVPAVCSQSAWPTASSLPGYPETTFLDSARLVTLSTDAADVTAMYMFLMLYRQLVFSNPRHSSSGQMPKVTESDLLQLKIEIRDIASCHLGYCFTRTLAEEPTAGEGSTKKTGDREWEKWQRAARDVVLQIAMRATQAQNCSRTSLSPTDRSFIHQPPDDRMLQLAERWLDTNLRHRSSFSVVLRNRFRDAVFHRLVATTFPTRDVSTEKLKATSESSTSPVASTTSSPPSGTVTGLESFTDEIRTLTDKLSKLSVIHLGVYLPLYEQDGFIQS